MVLKNFPAITMVKIALVVGDRHVHIQPWWCIHSDHSPSHGIWTRNLVHHVESSYFNWCYLILLIFVRCVSGASASFFYVTKLPSDTIF